MVYGVTNLVEDEPRFGSVYRHVGIIDHLVRYQEIERTIDAYFDWPGFFGLGALLVDAGDLASALPFAEWATVVVNLMYLGPLLLIFRGLGGGAADRLARRLALHPHELDRAGLLLAAVVRVLPVPRDPRPRPAALRPERCGSRAAGAVPSLRARGDGAAPRPRRPALATGAAATLVVMVGLLSAQRSCRATSSRPFALFLGAAALVVTRRCSLPTLPILLRRHDRRLDHAGRGAVPARGVGRHHRELRCGRAERERQRRRPPRAGAPTTSSSFASAGGHARLWGLTALSVVVAWRRGRSTRPRRCSSRRRS